MASRASVKIGNDAIQVDHHFLFQRLILGCNSSEDLASIFNFELASFPPALFEKYGAPTGTVNYQRSVQLRSNEQFVSLRRPLPLPRTYQLRRRRDSSYQTPRTRGPH